MGVVNHLQQFYIPFDAEHFIESHKDCPQDVALLQKLWKMVRPAVFWREDAIVQNDGFRLVLGSGDFSVESCYVAQGLAHCEKTTVLAAMSNALFFRKIEFEISVSSFF